MLGLCCCTKAFSSRGEPVLLFIVVQASHCAGFSCCRAQALDAQASIAVAACSAGAP